MKTCGHYTSSILTLTLDSAIVKAGHVEEESFSFRDTFDVVEPGVKEGINYADRVLFVVLVVDSEVA